MVKQNNKSYLHYWYCDRKVPNTEMFMIDFHISTFLIGKRLIDFFNAVQVWYYKSTGEIEKKVCFFRLIL